MLSQTRFFTLIRQSSPSFLLITLLAGCGSGNGNGSNSNIDSSSSGGDGISISNDSPVNLDAASDSIVDDGMDGSSSDSNNGLNTISDAPILKGIFIDGMVEGLTYNTGSQSGITNAFGEYTYIANENITFSIGALQFPSVTASKLLTPFQLASNSSNQLPTTLNIARLLQSLDDDANPDNGIRILAQAALSAAPVNFDVSPTEFENNSDVINLVANSGSVTTTLIHSSDTRFTAFK